MIIREARSRRKNPIQEKIVSDKDVLNDKTSKLIQLLIDSKKGWNGRPSPEIGIGEKTPITEPIAPQVDQAMKAVQQQLQDILNLYKQVQREQIEYSESRKQQQALNTTKRDADMKYFLLSTASNPFTRFFSHIAAPFVSDKGKWDRLSTLRSMARLEDALREIENNILNEDLESISKIIYKSKIFFEDAKSTFLDTIFTDIHSLAADIQQASKDQIAEMKKQEQEAIAKNKEELSASKKIEREQVSEEKREQRKKEKEEESVRNWEVAKERMKERMQLLQSLKKDKTITVPAETDVNAPIERPLNEPEKTSEPIVEKLVKKPSKKPGAIPSITTNKETPVDETPSVENETVETKVDEIPITSMEEYKKIIEMISISNKKAANAKVSDFWKNRIFDMLSKLQQLSSFISVSDKETIKEIFVNIVSVYSKIIGYIEAGEKELQLLFGDTPINEEEYRTNALLHIDEKAKANMEAERNLIKSAAHETGTRLSRWLKRIQTELVNSDDKQIRLKADSSCRNARKALNQLMDEYEEKIPSIESIVSIAKTFVSSIRDMFDKIADLGIVYNSDVRLSKSQDKKNSFDIVPNMEINYLKRIVTYLDKILQDINTVSNIKQNPVLESPSVGGMFG